jgi:hypothetical protein
MQMRGRLLMILASVLVAAALTVGPAAALIP